MAVREIIPMISEGHMAAPRLTPVDYSVFQKTFKEKAKLFGLKQRWIKKGGLKKFRAKQFELNEKFSF